MALNATVTLSSLISIYVLMENVDMEDLIQTFMPINVLNGVYIHIQDFLGHMSFAYLLYLLNIKISWSFEIPIPSLTSIVECSSCSIAFPSLYLA